MQEVKSTHSKKHVQKRAHTNCLPHSQMEDFLVSLRFDIWIRVTNVVSIMVNLYNVFLIATRSPPSMKQYRYFMLYFTVFFFLLVFPDVRHVIHRNNASVSTGLDFSCHGFHDAGTPSEYSLQTTEAHLCESLLVEYFSSCSACSSAVKCWRPSTSC